ncbi:MAG: M1 family metallopeptidase [Candidatus Hodarchaeales archaeon]|jgi:tricorn protease interacting factor F2/3
MVEIGPIHYNIHLEPNLKDFRFEGKTKLNVTYSENVEQVVLNSHELAIWKCQVQNEEQFVDCSFRVNPADQELIIDLPEARNNILLHFEFTGLINDQLVGFYRSKFEENGQTKYIAVTQFEEEHARQVFPCFDHPSKKATFDIEFLIDQEYSGIANTQIQKEEVLENGKKLIQFEKTPKMSSYLLFFGVGKFEFIESLSKGVLHRVATTPGKTQYGEFALDFGIKSIEFGEDYTGIKYPINKMDQIAVSDFAFGAMENYGAITYRENLLLVYPEITSKAGIERIAEVIAHEVAHQWFGNLVSPLDWKYIWLNESFATLFGYAIVDHYHPEWEFWESFLVGEVDSAFERDSLLETFPIELPGKDEKTKITAATAPIIYSKGGAILQMIKGYLGEENFKKGINTFLNKYQFECAESTAYWKGIEEATGEPIAEMMKTWVYQPGYPLIDVRKTGNILNLEQRRFSYLVNDSTDFWMIPLTVTFYNSNNEPETKKFVFKGRSMSIPIPSGTEAYKLNFEQTGFYRVMYELENLHSLGKLVKQKILSPRDRFGLHNDLYAFVRSTDYSIDDYLDFMEYYTEEDDYLPLVAMSANLVHAFQVVESRRERISAIGFKAFFKVLKQIGYEPKEDETNKVTNLRSSLLISSYLFNDEGVAEFGLQKFNEYLEGKSVHPDLLSSIMRIGAAQAPSSYSTLISKLEGADTPEPEVINILRAIGSFEEKDLLLKALEYVIEKVPSKNKYLPIAIAARNLFIVDHLWDWFKENKDELEKLHSMHFETVISTVVSLAGLNNPEEVKTYFEDYMQKKDLAKDTIKMTLERLAINSRLRMS